MTKVLLLAEHDNHHIKPATLTTLAAALKLSDTVDVLVAGLDCSGVAEQMSSYQGVAKVLWIDGAPYQHMLAENMAPVLRELSSHYTHVLAPATTFGKNIVPRVAALLDVAPISDVIEIVAQDTFIRPIYAGNALATVKSQDDVKFLTIRTTAFTPVEAKQGKAPIDKLDLIFDCSDIKFISVTADESKRPELTAARIVVSGGRGLQSKENFVLIEQLADTLNAAVGASRAVVDAGFVPNDHQVGQTGKVVAPDLYIAVGISGAIQHLAGMKDSKVIVAINKDPDAPIFSIADYGIVGDLFKIVPELIEALGSK